ncbi:MAG TPA: hypothetical protein PLH65_00820 [bacterium]|nr:hypothetical protein [bacterium]
MDNVMKSIAVKETANTIVGYEKVSAALWGTAMVLYPNGWWSYFNLSLFFTEQGEVKKAGEYAQKAMERMPKDLPVIYLMKLADLRNKAVNVLEGKGYQNDLSLLSKIVAEKEVSIEEIDISESIFDIRKELLLSLRKER